MKQHSLFFMFFLLLSSTTWPCGSLGIKESLDEKIIARNLPQHDTDEPRKTNGFCIACLENEACIINVGCGHVQYCKSCYERVCFTYRDLLQAFQANSPGSWLPNRPSCPCCRETFVQKYIIDLPFHAECKMPNCHNPALVYHDGCHTFVFCLSCASKTGEQQIQLCMNCLKKDGCLKYCRFPDEGEEDSAIPFEEPELMETP